MGLVFLSGLLFMSCFRFPLPCYFFIFSALAAMLTFIRTIVRSESAREWEWRCLVLGGQGAIPEREDRDDPTKMQTRRLNFQN